MTAHFTKQAKQGKMLEEEKRQIELPWKRKKSNKSSQLTIIFTAALIIWYGDRKSVKHGNLLSKYYGSPDKKKKKRFLFSSSVLQPYTGEITYWIRLQKWFTRASRVAFGHLWCTLKQSKISTYLLGFWLAGIKIR